MDRRPNDPKPQAGSEGSPTLLKWVCSVSAPAEFLSQGRKEERYKHRNNSHRREDRNGKRRTHSAQDPKCQNRNGRVDQDAQKIPALVLDALEIKCSLQELKDTRKAIFFISEKQRRKGWSKGSKGAHRQPGQQSNGTDGAQCPKWNTEREHQHEKREDGRGLFPLHKNFY